MPRSARIDLPGLVQRVIVRAVARKAAFRDAEDRGRFVAAGVNQGRRDELVGGGLRRGLGVPWI